MVEQTLIILKPDAVQRRLIGEIIGRFEKKGLKIVAAKFLQMTLPLAEELYACHKGKEFYDRLIKYIVRGPVMVIVLEGKKAIEVARKMIGATIGCDAQPGTIRGDFGLFQPPNLIHGSDSPESAKREISIFFKPDEILSYKMTDEEWF